MWLCAGVCTLPCCGRSARGWHWCQLGCGVCPADVDDCAASPCCQQVCTNSPGGYECSCYAGYRLSADGCRCEGEWRAAGVAGERAVLRMTRGGLWPPPSTLSLGVGLMPAVCRLVEAFLFPPLCGHCLSLWAGPAPPTAPGLPFLKQEARRVAVAWVSPSRSPSHGEGWGGRTVPRPRPLEDGRQCPWVCPQMWTSAPPAAVAASTTAPTWPAPSSAPVRPATSWMRTAGVAPVSLRLAPWDPVFLQHRGPTPCFPAGWTSPQTSLPLWDGLGMGGWEGLDRQGPPGKVLLRGPSGPASAPPRREEGLHSGTEDHVQSRGLSCPRALSTLRVPRASAGAGTAGADVARVRSSGPGSSSVLRSRLTPGDQGEEGHGEVCRWGSWGGTKGQGSQS